MQSASRTTRAGAAERATAAGGGGGGNSTAAAATSTTSEEQKKPRAKKPGTPFANDPIRSARLPFDADFAAPLSKQAFLQTSLIDFLLQHSFQFPARSKDHRFVMPKNLLVASSNCYEFLKVMTNEARFPTNSSSNTTQHHVDKIRDGYLPYSSDGPYRLLIVNCIGSNSHYNAVDISFDADSEEIFQHVHIYDSLHRTTTEKQGKSGGVSKLTHLGKFLCMLQQFLLRFSFFENDRVVKKLTECPHHILANATYLPTPQQSNACDCALF